VLYLFAGMTEDGVKAVSEKANDAALHDSLDTYVITSSAKRPGKTGVVSLSGYKKGLRLAPEMSNLMNVLRGSGFDVYICSASHETVVRVFAGLPKYGYNVPPENVIGMKTKMKDGVYQGEYDYSDGYPQTQQKGKSIAIKQILVSKYGYGPIFVAGDSQGDFNMATEFPDTQLTLLINRLRADDFGKLGVQAVRETGSEKARYVMQGRDENTGQFRPSTSTIKMGADVEALLHSSLLNP
jgi:phosphoserine phosphatase